VQFTVTEQGAVSDPSVLASRPRRVFDRAALRAIRQWRFTPKRVHGKPMPQRAQQLIEFKLSRR
jgi:protein TonB